MASDKNAKSGKRIHIRFLDSDTKGDSFPTGPPDMERLDPENDIEILSDDPDDAATPDELETASDGTGPETDDYKGGPDTAELVATRAELKRVEAENAELKDRLPRRTAAFAQL